MSQIKGKDTKPEVIVRKFLFSKGFRYRLHSKTLPGKPDIVLPKHNTVILIHGCFWHGHKNCKKFKMPKSNLSYWIPKINRNINRDAAHLKELKKLHWRVIVIWECQLKNEKHEKTLSQLVSKLSK